tara:strand:- start:742 stop:993 length:252 start_codon:yes stop_codon:yes gene_type:complete
MNILVAEILETGEVSKRSIVELESLDYEDTDVGYESKYEFGAMAHEIANAMTDFQKYEHIRFYNEGLFGEYTDYGNTSTSEEW